MKTQPNATIWLPDAAPHTVIHIIHGMTEHMGLYRAFAQTMTASGVAVAGFDLRGHGTKANGSGCAAMGRDGWAGSVEDIRDFSLELRTAYPAARHYMLGFSLGSFLLREYLAEYPDNGLSGAIIMGTGHQSRLLLSIMGAVVDTQIKKAGFDHTTDLVRQLSFGAYNRKFKPNRTMADWLCPDEKALGAYLGDPLCVKDISSGLFRQLLGSMTRTDFSGWRKDLPILLLSGEEDPVGDFGKGVKALEARLRRAGLNPRLGLIPNARHALLWKDTASAGEAADVILQFVQS